MPLTDAAIRNTKPGTKTFKLSDERGLYLLVNSAGKYFRFDYRFAGKRKTLALGVYPDVTLKDARERRDAARKLIANGVDPSQHKKISKLRQTEQATNSFQAVAIEWFSKNKNIWSSGHAETVIARLDQNVFPWIGNRAIAEITPQELLGVLRRIESRGAIDMAHRVKQICGQVFRYAIATGRADRDSSADLRGALTPSRPTHMAAITDPQKVGELMRAIDGYQGTLITRCALSLAPLSFIRPGNLRHAEWAEINIENAEWRIPGEKMKMRDPHIVPLSLQAIAIFREIEPLTGRGKYVFPCVRSSARPMSENTILAAIRRMGYTKEEMTGHGFRTTASTILHEMGWPSDVIERQLAHAERNKIKAAYNHAQHLPERRKMMQAWADYLDRLKNNSKIIPLKAAGSSA